MSTEVDRRASYDCLSEEDKYKIFTIFWDKCNKEEWFEKEIYNVYFNNIIIKDANVITNSDNITDEFWDDLEDFEINDDGEFENVPDVPDVPDVPETPEAPDVSREMRIDAHSLDTIVKQVSLKQDSLKHEMNTRLDIISQSITRRKENATVKGEHAETIMAEVLSDRWEYERTSHLPNQADFSVYMRIDRRYRILIDIKNYNKSIPSAEYDKFLRDIRSTNADAGIYFAYSGTITGRTRNITMDVFNTSTSQGPIILVQNSLPETMHLALDLIRTHFLIHNRSTMIDVDNIQYYIDQSLDQINQLYIVKNHIIKCTTQINEQLGHAQVELSESISKLQIYLGQISGRLQTTAPEWLSTSTENIPQIIDDTLPALGPRVRKEVVTILISICSKLEKEREDFLLQHQGNKLQVCDSKVTLGSRKQVITIPVIDTQKVVEIMKTQTGASYDGSSVSWELRKKYVSAIMSLL